MKSIVVLLALVLLQIAVTIVHGTAIPQRVQPDTMHPDLKRTINRGHQNAGENTNDYWLTLGGKNLVEKLNAVRNTNKAKNIILFLGDGMGLTTMAAARNYLGDESEKLSFERFPYSGLSKTYSVDKIVPDSACTSTSYQCGVKANYGTIGVNAHVQRGDCAAMANEDNHVFSLGKWAMDAGKAAGFVTTTRVTHASPAGIYAHTADRTWENDAALKEVCGENSGLDDIAVQLIYGEVGSKLKVMLGGGRRNFRGPEDHAKGRRNDSRNLINEFEEMSARNIYVNNQKKLLNVKADEVDRLLGIFSNSHMDYHLEAMANVDNKEPTLAEMTQKALEVLQTESNGFFLFVEGGKIDIGHHGTKARIALDETVELSKAVEVALEMTSDQDTLIVLTADHSHAFTFGGYQPRGSDIFAASSRTAADGLPYMALSYANGLGYDQFYDTEVRERLDPTKVQTGEYDDLFPAMAPLESETHGGEDVAVYAFGPWAHLFTGVYEQNTIPHMMAYAACVGGGLKSCD